jgi:hypothetical protein
VVGIVTLSDTQFDQKGESTMPARRISPDNLRLEDLKPEYLQKYLKDDRLKLAKIVARKTADDTITVIFPEAVDDLGLSSNDVPLEYLTAVLSRALAARMDVAEDCNNHCTKDCLW